MTPRAGAGTVLALTYGPVSLSQIPGPLLEETVEYLPHHGCMLTIHGIQTLRILVFLLEAAGIPADMDSLRQVTMEKEPLHN